MTQPDAAPGSDFASRSSRVATIAFLVITVVSGAAAIWLDALVLPGRAWDATPLSTGWAGALPGIAMAVPGLLLLWRLPWHPIAVVLSVFGVLWCVDGLAAAWVNWAWYFDRSAPLVELAFWYYARLGSILIMPIVLLLLLFPDGRFRRGRLGAILSWISVGLASLMSIAFVLSPREAMLVRIAPTDKIDAATQLTLLYDHPPVVLPLPLEAWLVLFDVAFPAMAVGGVIALGLCISRRVGASVEERSQLRWLVWSGTIFLVSLVGMRLLPVVISDVVLTAIIALVCGSVVIAVTRHRLYDIDRLLSWTLVYAALVASVVLVDVVLVVAIGSFIDDRTVMVIAVVLVTLVYAPLRDRLFTFASRLVNGRRYDPYGVVSELATRLEESVDTTQQLADVADAIARAFASGYVRIELDRPDGGRLAAEHGTARRDTVTMPLEYRGQAIGRILMEPGRRPVLSPRDQKLLGDLVRLAAAAMLNAELSAELQRIRENLVVAREEERSRLRRELHDGLGPLLGGVKLRLETARNLAERSPSASLDLLDAAIDDSAEVIVEIRRLVHDLRPPALDDLGLARAVEQQAERLSGGPLSIEVQADVPRRLPAAAEVAAYRIASEALTNVVRHADAKRAVVRLALDAAPRSLVVEVEDDGHGMPDAPVPGVGLHSLRDRASELGGRLELLPRDGGGTLVRARLPLADPVVPPAPAAALKEPARV